MAASDTGRTSELRRALLRGLVIPAHPLALTEARRLDERRQMALTRYYCDAGAGGIAVGVHTTQFAIRDPTTPSCARIWTSGSISASAVRLFGIARGGRRSHSGWRPLPSNTKVNNFGEGPAMIDPVAGVVPRPVGVEAAT